MTCARRGAGLAIRGDDALKVMQRAGHRDVKTTMGYVREAENLAHVIGDVVPRAARGARQASRESSSESCEGPAYWAQLREGVYESAASPAGRGPQLHP